MTMNCRYGRADAAEIIRNIRERNISVLALQEVTDDLITRLTEADINELLPYHQFKDASLIQAAGPNLTFPSWLKWPRIELDHVLFTPGLKPSGVKSFEVEGTDHLALTATLALR